MSDHKRVPQTKQAEITRALTILGGVLERSNRVERMLAEVIRLHVRPHADGDRFLRSHLLHNSVVSYNAKVKLVLAIARAAGRHQLDREALYRIGTIRNAFAHGEVQTATRKGVKAVLGTGAP